MKILIILLGRIGDMILSTPMFSAIKKKFPESEIHILASNSNYSIITNNPFIEKVFIFNKAPVKLIETFIKLRKENYDYLIDPKDHYSRESNILARLIKSKIKIGFNPVGKNTYHFGIKSYIENHELHFISRTFLALQHIGIVQQPTIPKPEVYPPNDSINYVGNVLKSITAKKNLVINISAGSQERIWKSENWMSVINNIDKDKFKIIITYAPSEAMQAKELSENVPHLLLFPSRNFNDVIALISRVNLIITPDTSVVHVASAYNIPIIALYTSYEDVYKKFHPLSDVQKVIFPNIKSYHIQDILPKDVIEAFDKIKELI